MKTLTLSLCLLAAVTAMAQYPQAHRLDLPAGAHHPVLSPDGGTLLFSSDIHTGLKALSLGSGEITEIDGAAIAGFQPSFSNDGTKIFYRTAAVVDGLSCRDVRCYDISRAHSERIAAPARDNALAVAFAGGDYAMANYNTISLSKDGVVKQLNPLSDSHSYLWASLSPDGSHLLFTEPFKGVFVSDADGSNPVRILDKGDFASWAGDHSVVAVVTADDGYVVLQSQLMLVNTRTGISRRLTPETVKVGEASASPSGKVVYTDLDGNMFILDLNDL